MEREKQNKLFIMFLLAVFSTIAMVTVSYAWIGISRVPFVSDINLSVVSENALMIATDDNGQPGEWEHSIDVSAIMENMVPLKPVTYTPNGFYKVNYGNDGRPIGFSPISVENVNVTYPGGDKNSSAGKAAEEQGYMLEIEYWLKAEGITADVFLSEAVATVDGNLGSGTYVVGQPVWNSSTISHDNGGHGAETTVRFGFECTTTDLDGNPVGNKTFLIYEPNADVHADGTTGYIVTESSQGGALITEDRLIKQTASTWSEQTPVLQDVVIYEMGEFLSNPALFTVENERMVHVKMYIWMEGQDIDCSNMVVGTETIIAANLQFKVADESKKDTGIVAR